MGRYRTEVGSQYQDPAGIYLSEARKERKAIWRTKHKADPVSPLVAGGTDSDASVWRIVESSMFPPDTDAFCRELFHGLPAGGRLLLNGLTREQREVVHRVSHHMGLTKTSRADPSGATGARQMCVERPAEASSSIPPSTADLPQRGTTAPPSVDIFSTPIPKQSRWRRQCPLEHHNVVQADVAPTPPSGVHLTEAHCAEVQQGDARVCEELEPQVKQTWALPGRACIIWLRDDMRLQDNRALLHAASSDYVAAVPVYIDDTCDRNPCPLRGAAKSFKHESLQAFSRSLAGVNSRLVVRKGDAVRQLLSLVQEFETCEVVFNRRCEPWSRNRDDEVIHALKGAGVSVRTFLANVLYEPWELCPIERWQVWRARVRAEEAKARGLEVEASARSGVPKQLEHISGFGSYRFFHHALEDAGDPEKPVEAVRHLPPCPDVQSALLGDLGYGATAGRGFTTARRQCAKESPSSGDWASNIKQWWVAGESVALERLETFLGSVLAPGDFEGRKRLVANSRNTSELSPYIRFGELSVRTVYWAARRRRETTGQKLFQDAKQSVRPRTGQRIEQSKGRANATFLRRFVWRDLSYWFLHEFPTLPTTSMRPHYEKQVWTGTPTQLELWKSGKTGYPVVDAAMRQLWAVGWMPNYMRHVVAQFLIEYLDVSWKEGLAWFDWTLVDADVAINSLMWQNGGHSGPDQWEFVLHPVNAAKTCDPSGAYVRQWIPELRGLPLEFIHRPWDAPLAYPRRVLLDLDAARREHARRVIDVRRKNPEIVARSGHEWLSLPNRKGLLAKVVTRHEFRAETEDFIFFQGPQRHERPRAGTQKEAMLDAARSLDATGPGL